MHGPGNMVSKCASGHLGGVTMTHYFSGEKMILSMNRHRDDKANSNSEYLSYLTNN